MDKKEILGVEESPVTNETDEALAEQLMIKDKIIEKLEWELAYLNLKDECYKFLFALEGIRIELEEPESHLLHPKSLKQLKELNEEMCRQAQDDAQGLKDFQIAINYLRQLATKPLKLKMGLSARSVKKIMEEQLDMLRAACEQVEGQHEE